MVVVTFSDKDLWFPNCITLMTAGNLCDVSQNVYKIGALLPTAGQSDA